jgi:hypothetical protein
VSTGRMKNLLTQCEVDPELWLDYVEDELDETLNEDMTLHASQCQECRKTLREFQLVRTNFKPVEFKELDDLKTQKLHSRIMNAVNQTYVEPELPSWLGQTKKIGLTVAATVILVFGSLLLPYNWNSRTNPTLSALSMEEQFFAATTFNHPEYLNSAIMSHQDSDDLVLEAAARKLSRMSDTEARMVFDQMK